MNAEIFLGFLVAVFIVVVNVVKSKALQKKEAASSPMHVDPKLKKQFQPAPNAVPQAQKGTPRPFAAPVTSGFEGYDPCHEEQLSGMPPRAGEEGFDPCHEEPLSSMDEIAAGKTDADREEAAQELLRGIVISEILGRRQPLKR